MSPNRPVSREDTPYQLSGDAHLKWAISRRILKKIVLNYNETIKTAKWKLENASDVLFQ